jgi:hypothetical protein
MSLAFLLISSVVTIAAVVPYVRDILHGRTRPNIASWTTWTLLFVVATFAEVGAGEYRTAFFTGSISVETALVALLGARYGHAKYTPFDAACQVGALSGFVVWWLFDDPLAAVVLVVVIDLLACLPTFEHSWLRPQEETWPTFALSGLGGFFALLALDSYNWSSVTYPAYIVAINIALVTLIVSRRRLLAIVGET